MTERPVVESPPDAVAEVARRADLGAYRFSVPMEGWRQIVGGLLAVIALSAPVAWIGGWFTDDYPLGTLPIVAAVVFVLAAGSALLLGRGDPVLYCFEAGAVRTEGRAVDARPWTAIAPYEWADVSDTKSLRVPHLELRAAGRKWGAVPTADVERVSTLVAEWTTPHATALVDSGAPVTYGRATVTRDALLIDDEPVPWTELREPLRSEDTLSLFADDRTPVELRRRDVPHERTLLQLIRERR